MPEPYRERYYQSEDGLRLYARFYDCPLPAAPAVLCLHGLTRNSRDFEDLAPHLRAHYRVIVPDLRGRGRSARDPHPENYRLAIYVRDVLKLIGTADISSLAIIGTSLGGLVAMMLAAARPPFVAGIVLNDVGPEMDPAGIERIKQYAGRMPAAVSWEDAAQQTRAIYASAWPDVAPERWPALARRGYRENAAGVPEADADPMVGEVLRSAPAAAADLWPLWAAIGDLPALAIRGAASDILSAATFARMKDEKPDLWQLTVPNRGHVPLLDEPECLQAIDQFLRRLFTP